MSLQPLWICYYLYVRIKYVYAHFSECFKFLPSPFQMICCRERRPSGPTFWHWYSVWCLLLSCLCVLQVGTWTNSCGAEAENQTEDAAVIVCGSADLHWTVRTAFCPVPVWWRVCGSNSSFDTTYVRQRVSTAASVCKKRFWQSFSHLSMRLLGYHHHDNDHHRGRLLNFCAVRIWLFILLLSLKDTTSFLSKNPLKCKLVSVKSSAQAWRCPQGSPDLMLTRFRHH